MKQIATGAKKAVKRARTLGWLPSPKAKAPTRRSSSPAATSRKSAPLPAGGSLLLRVESTPAGATVQLGSRIVGKTPVTLKVAPGTHKVTFIRKGYTTVTRSVTMKAGKAGQLQVALAEEGGATRQAAPQPVRKPAAVTKPAPTARKPAPAAKRSAPATVSGRLLDSGARAPAITLKDPSGAFHRLSDYRNRQVVVLFLWSLDSQSMRLVQDLDGRVRGAGQSLAGLVVVVNGDRAAVQKFAAGARVQVPLVIGDDQTARAYGIPKATNVAYVVSEGGLIAQRQVKTIQLSLLFTQDQKEGR